MGKEEILMHAPGAEWGESQSPNSISNTHTLSHSYFTRQSRSLSHVANDIASFFSFPSVFPSGTNGDE